MNTFLSIIKKKAVFIPLIAVVVLIAGISIYAATKKPDYKTIKVEKKDFTQEVSVTGKVVAANDVDLSFQTGGKVSSIPVSVGAKVTKGTPLAYVGSADLYATLLSRQAQLDAEKARYAELLRGSRPEELAISQTTYDQSKNALEAAISDAFIKSDNAVRNNADTLYDYPTTANPQIMYFPPDNLPYEFNKTLNDERLKVGEALTKWDASVRTMQSTGYSEASLATAKANLQTLQNFFRDLTLVVNSLKPGDNDLTQGTIDSYKAGISSSRSSISAAISALNGAEQAYRNATDQLALKKAGSSSEDLEAEAAAVKSAEANVLQVQAQLGNTVITAPFDGTVTKIDLKVGQQIAPSTPVISMISNANFQIESYIPEADIAKIKIGDVGTTTLDAYGDNVTFSVVVSAIDLSETEVDGVATYKTTLQFASFDDRIRSGMTANVDIVSGTHSGVLSIPQSALVSKTSNKTILVLDAKGKAVTTPITTGLIDANGNIEVTSGLNEGDTVVTNPTKK